MENIPVRSIKAVLKESTGSKSFGIREVKALLAGKDMVQELHRHDFYYILALKKGRGSHEIDFVPVEVCDNSVHLMRPGQVHQLTLKAGSAGYLIEFKTDFNYPHDAVSNQLLRKASNLNHYRTDAGKFKKLSSILTHIFQEYTEKQEKYQEVIKSNLHIFFVELTRLNNRAALNNVSTYTQEQLDKFLELLEAHITTHKQVSQFAGMLNLSTYQLNAVTKTMLGKTCSQVIDEYIILESKRHLLATSSQVNQVAYHLGYEDVSYFIRFFKKHTGYSPEAFRNNFK